MRIEDVFYKLQETVDPKRSFIITVDLKRYSFDPRPETEVGIWIGKKDGEEGNGIRYSGPTLEAALARFQEEQGHICTEWNGNGYCVECGEHFRAKP